jgi:hypothetical protein
MQFYRVCTCVCVCLKWVRSVPAVEKDLFVLCAHGGFDGWSGEMFVRRTIGKLERKFKGGTRNTFAGSNFGNLCHNFSSTQ